MATNLAVDLTPQDYLAFERRSPVKHEYVEGDLREMHGVTLSHSDIVQNLIALLRNAFRGSPFQSNGPELRLRIPNGPYYYPDVFVTPRPPELEDEHCDTVLNPLVIFEVLSVSTEEIDRGEKFDNYRKIPSLTDYFLVAQDKIVIERYIRDGREWRQETYTRPDDRIRLTSVSCGILLADVYDGVLSD